MRACIVPPWFLFSAMTPCSAPKCQSMKTLRTAWRLGQLQSGEQRREDATEQDGNVHVLSLCPKMEPHLPTKRTISELRIWTETFCLLVVLLTIKIN